MVKKMTGRIIKKAQSLFLLLLSPFLLIIERRLYGGLFPEEGSALAPIFIVGAPRTGSTILYQAITNRFKVSYIDNLASLFYRNLRFGIWLSKKKYGDEPHNNFRAEFGNTNKFGGHAPSECGEFWYRWLPRSDHYADSLSVSNRAKRKIRREVLGVSKKYGQPFVFKNLNAGQRLKLIADIFPDAKILFVRRDPVFVVRSILKAREKLGVPPGQWWSVRPVNFRSLLDLGEVEMCAAQVHYLESQIISDIGLFDENNVRTIHYDDFSDDLVASLGSWLGLRKREGAVSPDFRDDERFKLSAEELRSLQEAVSSVGENK